MIEGQHKDTVCKAKHKSGWHIFNYIFEVNHFAYSYMRFRACDEEHAWKQARKWANEKGVEIIRMVGEE